MLLLQYFEEEKAQKCGHCDVCILEKKAALSNLEVQKMSEKILAILQKAPITVVQLIENFKQFNEDEAFEVLHWLQEINQVEERNGLLYVNTTTAS
jgi:ATP-dependent DNA helicase RecQ